MMLKTCDITTHMALAIGHVMNLYLSSSLITISKKHVSFKICLHLRVVPKGNPPTITRQRNTFARNGRCECQIAFKTQRHHFTHWVTFHISRFKTLFVNQNLSLVYIISMHHKYGTQDILIGQR